MSKKTRRYSADFKRESINYALKSESIVQAAKDLGIPDATLHTWIKLAKKQGNFPTPGKESTVNVGELIDENKSLRKRLAKLEQEKAILKKAATYFAQELE